VPRAVGLADELLKGWAPIIASIEMLPSSKGRFEVTLDGELIFSKATLGRHAEPGEDVALVRDRVGAEIPRD
jgi:selenoprotein W-related protein